MSGNGAMDTIGCCLHKKSLIDLVSYKQARKR